MSDTENATAPQEGIEQPVATPEEGVQPAETPAAPAVAEPAEPAPEPAKSDEMLRALEREPYNKRIGILSAKYAAEAEQRAALERERETLRAELDRYRQQQQPAQQLTQEQAEQLIEQKAEERAQRRIAQSLQESEQRELNARINSTIEVGREKFGMAAFDAACANLHSLGALENKDFLPAVTELSHKEDVLQFLGTHPAELDRIMGLSAARMGVALAELQSRVTAPPPPKPLSRAPAPIAPIEGGVSQAEPDIYDPNISTERFIALRNKQEAARRGR